MVTVELKRDYLERNLIRQNCSKKELAYRIGISRGYLSAVCTGRVKPSPSMRQRFVEYFKCTFDDLFVIREKDRCKTN